MKAGLPAIQSVRHDPGAVQSRTSGPPRCGSDPSDRSFSSDAITLVPTSCALAVPDKHPRRLEGGSWLLWAGAAVSCRVDPQVAARSLMCRSFVRNGLPNGEDASRSKHVIGTAVHCSSASGSVSPLAVRASDDEAVSRLDSCNAQRMQQSAACGHTAPARSKHQ
jgi:hypothetical protein